MHRRARRPQLTRCPLGTWASTMTPMRSVLTLGVLAAGAAPARAQDLLPVAKRVLVASLDSTLPPVPFDKWLAELGGVPISAIEWEVNDCGEGGDGREAPTCVEATLPLTGDTTAHASLVVAGIDGRRSTPAIWDLAVGAGHSFTGFATLREWAAYIQRHRR